ncbi:MAG: hypothetical protein ACLTER_17715 [Ruminococcus sp.]
MDYFKSSRQRRTHCRCKETLGMDTSEAQANVEAVADKIKGLDTNVKATYDL